MAICKIDGCQSKSAGQGLCSKHYARLRKHGDPLFMKRPTPDRDPPPICKIDGCDKKTCSLGMCSAHYTRYKRHGDPLRGRTCLGEPMKFLMSALESKNEDCITWPYARTKRGYGLVDYKGRQTSASNVACRLAHGEPPTDKHECAHNCGKGHEGCVNPKHLRWATKTENHADKHIHGTHNQGERNHASKLTEDQARYVKSNLDNISVAELADRFGVTDAAIYAILNGRNWAWLE